ncbi:hypothetical protein A2W24_04555 [Microgenomates group bacterium RBG_16_45_19]|nr:MAG: hypothetical protein A2W24_04555 [Microgenomates group bacterium RBG_16_45_19]
MKKGRTFSLISRQIRVAVKEGKSGDPNQNSTLRLALEKARQANMPKEKVERAIESGLGKTAAGGVIEEVMYEAYGPGGVGLRILVVTDNRNRAGAEVRRVIERTGGSLASPGATGYLFESGSAGQVTVDETEKAKVEALIEALEALDEVELVVSNLT